MKKQAIGMVVSILTITAIFSATGTLNNTNQPKCIGTPLETDDWVMLGHDAGRSGFSTSAAPKRYMIWDNSTGASIQSSPAVANDKIYVGANDGKLYCFDALTGHKEWSYPAGGTPSSPAVIDGYVYFAAETKVTCLNAANGNEIWVSSSLGSPLTPPAVADGFVYIGQFDNVYCLYATNGTPKWKQSIHSPVSPPAVADGCVYFGTREPRIYCLDGENGGPMWDYLLGGNTLWYTYAPAVVDGSVYIGSSVSVNYIKGSKIYCFNAKNGNDPVWVSAFFENISLGIRLPAVAYGNIYVGGTNTSVQSTQVYCLNASNGHLTWNQTVGSGMVGLTYSLAVADRLVYLGSNDHHVYCLDALGDGTGATDVIWSYDVGDSIDIASSPAIANGFLYITTKSSATNVYCFGGGNQPPGTPTVPSGPTKGGPGIAYTYTTTANDPDDDTLQYQFDWDAAGAHNYSGWIDTSGAIHAWATAGTYEVNVKVRDAYHAESPWSDPLSVLINTPPDAPDKPSGPTEGDIRTLYIYSTKAVDPDSHQVKYGWDWNGDDVVDEWTEFFDSNVPIQISHMWTTGGTYQIKVKAQDTYNATSEWSQPLGVTIRQARLEIGNITGGWGGFLKGGMISAEIKNTGDADATNVTWTITVTGGILGRINKTILGTIPLLKAGATENAVITSIFGLGKIKITVNASADYLGEVTKQADGFIVFFFIRGIK